MKRAGDDPTIGPDDRTGRWPRTGHLPIDQFGSPERLDLHHRILNESSRRLKSRLFEFLESKRTLRKCL